MEGAIDAKDSDIKSLKAAKAITTQKRKKGHFVVALPVVDIAK